MKPNDKELQAQLSRSLPPEDLAVQSDAELEALLDAEACAKVVAFPKRTYAVAAAAAVVFALLAYAALRPPADEVGEGVVDAAAGENAALVEMPEPEHVGTPEPQVAKEKDWVEFTPEFPKPIFGAPPRRIERSNIDPSRKPRLGFKAPLGTRVVSVGARVTSSDPEPLIGDLEMVTDGDKDGTDGSYVELAPGKQWVQIDLGEQREIWNLIVWHFHKHTRAYDDVIVQFSDDPGFEKFVRTAFNNDHDDSSGMGRGEDPAWIETHHGRIIDAGGVVARYVRLYSNGNTANTVNHYVEVEVWGK